MGVTKVSAITVGVAAAFAVGVWVSPQLLQPSRWGEWRAQAATAEDAPAIPSATVAVPSRIAPATAPSRAVPAKPAAPRNSTPAAPARSAAPAARSTPELSASTPQLQTHLKPLLMSGSNMAIAADGFTSAEQFASVAHAARNTGVPFVLLKDRVVNQKKSLAAAIAELKPHLNAAAEAARARAEARNDLDEIGQS